MCAGLLTVPSEEVRQCDAHALINYAGGYALGDPC